jgi:hypothetical protein
LVKKQGHATAKNHRTRSHLWKDMDLRTEEDKRVDGDKWLHREKYAELVASGTIVGHRGNESGVIRSSYWPNRVGLRPDEGEDSKETTNRNQEQHHTEDLATPESNTMIHDLEALRMLWIKEDTTWNTEEVFGAYKKKLRPFSEDYKHRKVKLLGHVIRADTDDPMRKVTFQPETIQEWGTSHRRVGRPKEQWLQGAKKQARKKCRHMEDRQGHTKPDKRTKYKGKPLQEAYIHTWAEERQF